METVFLPLSCLLFPFHSSLHSPHLSLTTCPDMVGEMCSWAADLDPFVDHEGWELFLLVGKCINCLVTI